MLNNVACKSLPSENMPVENRTHSVLSETDVSTCQVIKRTIPSIIFGNLVQKTIHLFKMSVMG